MAYITQRTCLGAVYGGKNKSAQMVIHGAWIVFIRKEQNTKAKGSYFKRRFPRWTQTPAWIWQASHGRPRMLHLTTMPAGSSSSTGAIYFPTKKKCREDSRGKSHSQLWLARHTREDSLTANTKRVSDPEFFILQRPPRSDAAILSLAGTRTPRKQTSAQAHVSACGL